MSDAIQKQQFLACLGDPSRFTLLATLAGGPRCVTELAGLVGLSQSCTTRHLQALQREGIVTGERRGKRVVFSLGGPGRDVHPVLRWAFDLATVPADVPAAPAPSRPPKSGDRSPVRPDGIDRGRSRRSAEAPRWPSLDPSIEVTDALIVAHDAGWESDDGESGLVRAEVEAAHDTSPGSSRPLAQRAQRADLDDFLL